MASLVLLGVTGAVQAQAALPRRFEPYAPFIGRPMRAVGASSLDAPPRTYAIEGAVAGGAAVGILTGAVAQGLCHEESSRGHCLLSTVGGALMGALIGCVVGGLIGSFVPKGAP